MPILKLVAFVLPLGLDSFGVAAAIGAAGRLTARARWRISALFVVFEAGMPLIGLALGAPLAHVMGDTADYLAAAAVIAIGMWMLLHSEQDEEEKTGRLATAQGVALLGLGISISLDELAIGFSLGLTHLPLIPVIVGIAAQAFLAAQLGLHLGRRIAERYREAAERLAGIVLIGLGLFLVAERVFA
ncbi:manganese efflux pump MntP [Amycolatopsis sp. H20-H5]|uniref:manganese efflux pump MntP n=1 Tax=Amycolatopsis sp. H20-H5 TaxID=3046309 RepID=UPI002DBED026|nr:manganese efflux pump [Amycolatopsis sp. H20-H5]MEC3974418.1 manganese efflux pump [Amycolatopsis sp. H20-H5]